MLGGQGRHRSKDMFYFAGVHFEKRFPMLGGQVPRQGHSLFRQNEFQIRISNARAQVSKHAVGVHVLKMHAGFHIANAWG